MFDDRIHQLNLSKLGKSLKNLNYKMVSKGVINRYFSLLGKGHRSHGISKIEIWHGYCITILVLINTGYLLLVHPESRFDFEAAIKVEFKPFEEHPCSNFIKHKRCSTDLKWLDKHSIKYSIVS